MSLTAAQAARLFALDRSVCDRVLHELTELRLLAKSATGCYGLASGAFNRKAG